MVAPVRLSALERLKKAANLERTKKTVVLNNGEKFEFYSTPLTMAERDRALRNRNADKGNDEDNIAFGLHVFVMKATDENGHRLFQAGHIAEIKNEVQFTDILSLVRAVLNDESELFEDLDPKSSSNN